MSVFVIILAVYISFQVYKVVYPAYRSETAVLFTVTDSVPFTGLAVRNEAVIDFNAVGTLNFRVNDGDKVAVGSVVADLYSSKSIARDVKIRSMLQSEINALRRAADAGQNTVSNLDSLSEQIHRAMIALSQSIESGSPESIETDRIASLELLSVFASATGTNIDYESAIARIAAEVEAIDRAMLSTSGEIRTDEGGYFASFTDGFEHLFYDGNMIYKNRADFDIEQSEPLGPADIEYLINSDIYRPNSNSCKVILDYTWFFAALVDLKYEPRFFEGQVLNLDLNYALLRGLPVKIESIVHDEQSDKLMIVLSCEYLNSDMTGLRIEEGEISFKNYKGIRIPRSAIRVVDGAVGVFTKYDNKVLFKKIRYAFETDEYVLATPSELSGELKLYDEILLEGKELYDGKSLG